MCSIDKVLMWFGYFCHTGAKPPQRPSSPLKSNHTTMQTLMEISPATYVRFFKFNEL